MPHAPDILRLFEQHHAYVWRYLRFLGAAPEQADDLTQDTFMKLLDGRPFDERSDAETARYLTTVARNLWFATLRRSKIATQQPLPSEDDLQLADATWQAAYDGAGGEDARLEALRGCMELLTGTAREAVTLFYEQQLTGAQIAEQLGRSDDYVRTLLYRTRNTLRDCVNRKTRSDA